MILAKHPASLEINPDPLKLIYYSCAQEKPKTAFQVFPTKEVDIRAAAACTRTNEKDPQNDFLLTALLLPEEEGSVFQGILESTLDRITSIAGDSGKLQRRQRRILADSFRKIQRRGGSAEKALCPYLYERPTKAEVLVSFCRVVKKQCYLTIYQMPGYPHCPRYIRRQRRNQLANTSRIVRAGIQRILEESDAKRKNSKGQSSISWVEPVHTIIDRLFSVLPVSEKTIDLAFDMVTQIGRTGLFQGHPRPIVAASVAYYAAKQMGDAIPENDIIELVGCSRTSLRRNYRELRAYFKKLEEQKSQKPKQPQRKSRSKSKVAVH